MASETFKKRQKERARQEKKQRKAERLRERRNEKGKTIDKPDNEEQETTEPVSREPAALASQSILVAQ